MAQIIESPDGPAPQFPRANIWSVLASNPRNVPDSAPAYIRLDGKVVTRGQLFTDAKRLAWALRNKLNLQRGDRIGIFSPNSTIYPVLVHAGYIAGIVLVPMNPAYLADELIHPIQDAAFKYLFVHPNTLKVGRKAMKAAGRQPKTDDGKPAIWLLSDADKLQEGDQGEQDTRTLLGNEQLEPVRIDQPEEEVALICYSSGTTGKSKGTELTHHNNSSNIILVENSLGKFYGPKDTHLGVLPFQHIFAMSKHVHHAVYAGVPVVVMEKFDLEPFLSALQRYKVSVCMLVPPIGVLLAKHPLIDKYDLRSLKFAMFGAAPLSAELGDEIEARLPGLRLTQGYGLSETSPTVSFTGWDRYHKAKGSAGRLIPGVQMRIVEPETGKDVGFEQGDKGKPGELWFRGPIVFKRYLNNPTATSGCKTDDGWFATGDVGNYLAGQIYIVDRLKELIKYKGFQVAPAELEALLLTHPKVADAAVIGMYSKAEATEFPRAYVTPRLGAIDMKDRSATDKFAKEVHDWVNSKVANHKKLRGGVKVIETVPKSPSGKILRRVLRDEALKEGGEARAKL